MLTCLEGQAATSKHEPSSTKCREASEDTAIEVVKRILSEPVSAIAATEGQVWLFLEPAQCPTVSREDSGAGSVVLI